MSTKVKVVNLSGSLTLSTVPDLKDELLSGIDEKPLVYASLSKSDEIDLAGIQLLYAARRYALSQDKEFHLTGTVPEAIAERLYRSGFVSRIVREGKELDEELHEFGYIGGGNDSEGKHDA